MRNCESVERANLASNKRVNYTFGMVLGELDFRQEQEHFEWKHRLSNSLLHGYGTVCGLLVTAEPDVAEADVKIRISAGYGISPRGDWIWVPSDQCAFLNEWVQGHRNEVAEFAAPGSHSVYVTLCYDECAVDLVPIAGRPCATEEDTRAPSRIQEAFQAKFAWQPPVHAAELAYQDLDLILDSVEITDTDPPDDEALLLDLIRGLGLPSSPPLFGSPGPGPIQLSRATANYTLRRALIIWATEVCPRLVETNKDCFLLARVDFDVDAAGNVVNTSVEVDDRDRPVLVSDRVQQEFNIRFWKGVSPPPT